MFIRRFILFITADLVLLALLLLFFTYYGLGHIFLLVLGIALFSLSLYDSSTGQLSMILAALFGLEERPAGRKLNWLPALLSLVLIIYGTALFWEHGLINEAQQLAMQDGLFPFFALYVFIATVVVIFFAVYTASRKNKK